MRENSEKWMDLCAQAATEQDSRKLMALIAQITALLDTQQERLIEKNSQGESRNELISQPCAVMASWNPLGKLCVPIKADFLTKGFSKTAVSFMARRAS